jgi:hypothetical protein
VNFFVFNCLIFVELLSIIVKLSFHRYANRQIRK